MLTSFILNLLVSHIIISRFTNFESFSASWFTGCKPVGRLVLILMAVNECT